MKATLFLLMFSISTAASAYEVQLLPFDQEKLAGLLHRLPAEALVRTSRIIQTPLEGIKIRYNFPREEAGFKISCENVYYNNSPYSSASDCKITIDEQHPMIERHYDEFKVAFNDPQTSAALFQAISYGKPEKEFRSFGKERGVSFEGKSTWIFHYYFKCGSNSCTFKFLNQSDSGYLDDI